MDGTVKIPVIGTVKKGTAITGGLAVGGILIVLWIRQRKAAAATVNPIASSTGQQTDPAGNTGTIDPQTGYVSGSPQDLAALGTGGGLGTTGQAFYDPTTGQYDLPQPFQGTTGFQTNAEWAQAVQQYLTGSEQLGAEKVGEAIARYIAGQPLTADQVQIVEQAIAFQGQPPVSGPGGNPPGFLTQPPKKTKTPPKTKLVTAPGGKTFAELAAAYHTTLDELRKLNPALVARYKGGPVPKGVRFRVPVEGS